MSTPKIIYLMLFVFNIIVFIGCNSTDSKNIMAEYGNGNVVEFGELNQFVADYFYNYKFRDTLQAYTDGLNDLVINKMKRLDFFKQRMDTVDSIVKQISRPLNEEITVKYYEMNFLSKYTNDEFTKKIYSVMGRSVYYSEIEIAKKKFESKEEEDKVYDILSKLRTQVSEGKDIRKTINEHSKDIVVNKISYNQPPIGWKQILADPVSENIFNSKEGETIILSAETSYKIVKVTKVLEAEVEPYNKVKSKLIEECIKQYSDLALNEYNNYKNSLIDTSSMVWNENELEKIAKFTETPSFFMAYYGPPLSKEIKNGNATIVTYEGGSVDYKYLLYLINNILTINNKTVLSKEIVKKFIIDAITRDLIVKEGISLGLQKELFKNYEENQILRVKLLQLYDKEMIENKIPELDEKRSIDFYNANKDSIFYQLQKVTFNIIVFDKKQEADEAIVKIKNGTQFNKIKDRILIRQYIKEKEGNIKNLLATEEPIFKNIVFDMDKNEVSDPIEFTDEEGNIKYAIIKCRDIRPEKQLTYEESKKSIKQEYTAYYKNKLEKEIDKELKNRYQPKLYLDRVKEIISSINAK